MLSWQGKGVKVENLTGCAAQPRSLQLLPNSPCSASCCPAREGNTDFPALSLPQTPLRLWVSLCLAPDLRYLPGPSLLLPSYLTLPSLRKISAHQMVPVNMGMPQKHVRLQPPWVVKLDILNHTFHPLGL